MVFSLFSGLHDYHHNPISDTFIITERNHGNIISHTPFLFFPTPSLLQPQETTCLLSVSMESPILDILHKWHCVTYDAL